MIDFQIILNYNITVVKNSKQKESPKEGSYDKLAADFDCYSFSGLLFGVSLVAPMGYENVLSCISALCGRQPDTSDHERAVSQIHRSGGEILLETSRGKTVAETELKV